MASSKLQNQISYLKGVGPQRGELLTNELSIQILEDLLLHFPYRYIDKTQFHKINEINEEDDFVQVKGILRRFEYVGDGRKKRLVARLRDETGSIELVWFQQLHWVEKNLKIETPYIVYGRLNNFKGQFNIPHPEIEEINDQNQQAASAFEPVYSTTEKLSAKGLDAKGIRKLTKTLIESITNTDIDETLPDYLLQKFKFPKILQAFQDIHFPKTASTLESARNRLKFEELFYLQLRLLRLRKQRNVTTKGHNFTIIGDYFNTFFNEKLPFELTTAQKRVIKEIRKDVGSGKQMNRLLQGDVGSGKTVVALMTMLMALDNSQDGIPYQACLMAPTEILAQQHFIGISEMLKEMHINVAFLSGSIKGKKRERILELLQSGEIHILIGTHALIEDWVVYKNLGIVIIDEQHRFGVAQRAALWKKGLHLPPHVLVMTATPIPRTLAMTLYGDLDVSVIDELPPGRKEIKTLHKTEQHRLRVIGFMKEEIAKGRQIYVVFPLIEESETLDLLALQQGYEALLQEFPLPEYKISVVHGKQKPADKDAEMQRFVKGETQIMVATTVIEVGVNVPNASVMIIENTERFGLSQLHQLRGRVGRGAEQSFCILMTKYNLSKDALERINTMTRTNNGFEISEVDLRLRGPGNIEGTQQSGILNLRLADLANDGRIIQTAREIAQRILDQDPNLEQPFHRCLKETLQKQAKALKGWSRIS